MNVYRVVLSSPTEGGETWVVEGSRASSAIGRALRKTNYQKASELIIRCKLVEKNITYREWKRKQNIEELGY